MGKNNNLFSDYLDYLLEIEEYTDIYIYSRDQIGNHFPTYLADKLKKLGLAHDFDDQRSKRKHNWYAYGAMIQNGNVKFESISTPKSKLEYEDDKVLMISTCWNKDYGNLEPVFIDKASNHNLWFQDTNFRGLIFVIYRNGKVMDSTAFDFSQEQGIIAKIDILSSDNEYSIKRNWKNNIVKYDSSEKQFIEQLVLNSQYDKANELLIDKINSGNIQQDWVYSYYIGINFEYLKNKKIAQLSFEKYKSLISKNSSIYKFINKWNVDRLYSKLILSTYLDEHQFEIRNIARNIKEDTKRFPKYPVFVYWGQGFNEAPPIVGAAYRRLQKVVPLEALVTLSEDNVREFIEIPKIVDNLRSVSYANYSDYIRFAILAKYGGAWVDATAFVSEDFYIRLNQYNNQDSAYPMDGPITIMGSWFRAYKQSSHLGEKMLQATTLFWLEKFSAFPFYFFIDFLEQYYADFKVEPKKERDTFHWTRDKSFALRDNLANKFDKEWSEELLSHQLVHKLNYKLTDWENLEKKDSLYRAIVDGRNPFD